MKTSPFSFPPIVACLFCFLTSLAGRSQTMDRDIEIMVSGEVKNPLQLTSERLAAFTSKQVGIRDRNGKTQVYTGIPVIDILDSAGVTLGRELRGENLKKYLLVKCADGYRVLFSLAELDKDFGNKTVLLAGLVDGKPLPAGKGPWRLIVPDDRAMARSSFEVTELVVGFARD